MPPKKQITREAILNKALEMTRRDGFESITARALSASLNCSTQPIYQSFADMKALAKAVSARSFAIMPDDIQRDRDRMLPADLSIVLQYIYFTLQEKYLFQVIARNKCFQLPVDTQSLDMPALDQKLIIFTNGIVFMLSFQSIDLSWQQIQDVSIEAYKAFCAGAKQ